MRARPTRLAVAAVGAAAALLAAGCTGPSSSDDGVETAEVSSPSATESTTSAPAEQASRIEQIRSAGRLRVCTTGDYPPFTEKTDGGQLKGIDVDMARNLAETIGVEAEFVDTSWKTLMDDYLGKCDIAVGGISMNPERAEKVYFSVATQEDGKTPITRCENVEKYDTIDEINKPGVRSIFPEGGTNEKFAREHYPDGELLTHDNLTIFDALAAGEADVMTTDRSEVLYIDHEYPELCAASPDDPFDYFVKGYMLPQGDEAFKHYVDQWLTIALKDGTYDRFAGPWVGDVDLSLKD